MERSRRIEPPINTVAIVVDVPHNKGAVQIYNGALGDTHVKTVGTEDAGFMVIVR